MIIDALIPVKAAAAGKERLARVLPPETRAALVRAMLRDIVAALRGSASLRQVAVTSPDPAMLALAAGLGALPLAEPAGTAGLNGALQAALARLGEDGAEAVLIVQGDLPQIQPADVAAILGPLVADAGPRATPDAVAGRPGPDSPVTTGPLPPAPESVPAEASTVVVAEPAHSAGHFPRLVRAVPSADGGTSALLLVPPAVIAPCFGPDSFDRHRAAAAAAAVAFEQCELPLLAWDVDRPEDLTRLLHGDQAPNTRAVLLAAGSLPSDR